MWRPELVWEDKSDYYSRRTNEDIPDSGNSVSDDSEAAAKPGRPFRDIRAWASRAEAANRSPKPETLVGKQAVF